MIDSFYTTNRSTTSLEYERGRRETHPEYPPRGAIPGEVGAYMAAPPSLTNAGPGFRTKSIASTFAVSVSHSLLPLAFAILSSRCIYTDTTKLPRPPKKAQ